MQHRDGLRQGATVHTRFPYCVVAFVVALPLPVLRPPQRRAIASTLERLGSRRDELDQHHLAGSIALVVWDLATGGIEQPDEATRNVHLDAMPGRIHASYIDRYQHLPPHGS